MKVVLTRDIADEFFGCFDNGFLFGWFWNVDRFVDLLEEFLEVLALTLRFCPGGLAL